MLSPWKRSSTDVSRTAVETAIALGGWARGWCRLVSGRRHALGARAPYAPPNGREARARAGAPIRAASDTVACVARHQWRDRPCRWACNRAPEGFEGVIPMRRFSAALATLAILVAACGATSAAGSAAVSPPPFAPGERPASSCGSTVAAPRAPGRPTRRRRWRCCPARRGRIVAGPVRRGRTGGRPLRRGSCRRGRARQRDRPRDRRRRRLPADRRGRVPDHRQGRPEPHGRRDTARPGWHGVGRQRDAALPARASTTSDRPRSP